MPESLIGWLVLSLIGLVLVAQILSFVFAKRVFMAIASGQNYASLRTDAEKANKAGPRARLRWLKARLGELAGDVRNVALLSIRLDLSSNILFGILILVWLYAAIR